MTLGDHLRVSRGFYFHHGIDIGGGRVVHYSGEPGDKANASICNDARGDFANGGVVEVVDYGACDESVVVVMRANSRLGECGYHLVFSNCEHFARWCKTGSAESEQVRNAVGKSAASVVAGTGAAAGLGVVSAAGTVAGLSGPGIMTGLAAVTGSAVGSMVLLGALPGVVGVGILNSTVFADDEHATQDERDACRAGRVGTTVGVVAGSAGAIGAVAATGVAGLSGVGITSGLAGIGAVVGGGMAAGTVAVIAAPLVVAAAVGAVFSGIFRLFR